MVATKRDYVAKNETKREGILVPGAVIVFVLFFENSPPIIVSDKFVCPLPNRRERIDSGRQTRDVFCSNCYSNEIIPAAVNRILNENFVRNRRRGKTLRDTYDTARRRGGRRVKESVKYLVFFHRSVRRYQFLKRNKRRIKINGPCSGIRVENESEIHTPHEKLSVFVIFVDARPVVVFF